MTVRHPCSFELTSYGHGMPDASIHTHSAVTKRATVNTIKSFGFIGVATAALLRLRRDGGIGPSGAGACGARNVRFRGGCRSVAESRTCTIAHSAIALSAPAQHGIRVHHRLRHRQPGGHHVLAYFP